MRDERSKEILREFAKLNPEDPERRLRRNLKRHENKMPTKRKSKGAYMISAVAEMYEIHPQTLRLYEREGLLQPSRTVGKTRLTPMKTWSGWSSFLTWRANWGST